MLEKSLVFMMLLAASLIVIGSAVHHRPEVAIAQPQPQQPLQPQQSPAQPLQPQQSQQQAQTPSTAPPSLGKRLTQADQELLDRLFPHILRNFFGKVDGKSLAQKIDAATLVQKIDAKTLAAKVLPFLDIKVVAIERPGPKHNIDITGLREARATAKASCAPEESLIGGGFDVTGYDHAAPFYSHKESLLSPDKRWIVPPDTKTWMATTYFEHDGSITTYAQCLKVELGLLSEPRPPASPPPSQPPGGPPLQPPPGFGK